MFKVKHNICISISPDTLKDIKTIFGQSSISDKIDQILLTQSQFSSKLINLQTSMNETKEILMSVKQTIEEYATKVNEFSNAEAAALVTISDQLAALTF